MTGSWEAPAGSEPTRVDRNQMAALVVRQLPGLRAFVRMRLPPAVRNRESCDDVVQSVCGDLMAGLERFDYRSDLETRRWLFVSALHKIRERERYHLAERRSPTHERATDFDRELEAAYARITTPSEVAMSSERMGQIERALDALPPQYREVILLSRLAGLSRQETAAQMQCTEGAVRNLLHRAVVRLAWLMERSERGDRGDEPLEVDA